MPSDYSVAETGDGLQVRGVSRAELTEALDLLGHVRALRAEHPTNRGLAESVFLERFESMLTGGRGEWAEAAELYNAVRALQAEHADATRDELLRALMGRSISLTPVATLDQARELATHRHALLATPYHTYESLGRLRGDKDESATRTWVSRRRAAHELFTVTHKGRVLIPEFQFDGQGAPRAELRPILSALADGGVQGWPLWTWLTKPTSFLSGQVPEQAALTDPIRTLRAAQRFAANSSV